MTEISKTKRTVTISADYFVELFRKAEDWASLTDAVKPLVKERDELKERLAVHDTECGECNQSKRLAEAERCIEEMWSKMQTFDIPDRQRLIELESIIRAYREQKEAK